MFCRHFQRGMAFCKTVFNLMSAGIQMSMTLLDRLAFKTAGSMASALKNQNWLGALKVLPEHFQNLTQCKIVATIFKKKREQKTDDDLSSCIQKHILNAFFCYTTSHKFYALLCSWCLWTNLIRYQSTRYCLALFITIWLLFHLHLFDPD